MEDNIKESRKASDALYDSLKDSGYEGLPSKDSFYETLQDSTQAAAIYQSLKDDEYDGLPDEDSFFRTFIDGYGGAEPAGQAEGTTEAPATAETQTPSPESIPGSDEWRALGVASPGNPYNGKTYGEVYDSVIQDYGRNLANPDIDPYAEARAQIMQAGITDDMKPEEADKLALDIREGYANRYASNGAKEMVAALPDQVPNIDDLMDGQWYNRDLQGRISHEAARLGLRRENYVNYYVKPHIAKALSDRYGFDAVSAGHIAKRLLSQEDHTADQIRRREAVGIIAANAGERIDEQFQKIQQAADEQTRAEAEGSMMTPFGNAGQAMGAAIRNWQSSDPEAVWQQVKPFFDDMGSWLGIVGNQQLFEQVSQMADSENIPVNTYIDQYVLPAYADTVKREFERIAVEREMPKNTFDYVMGKVGQSLVGTVGRWMVESKARMRAQDEALQMTDAGQNTDYTPGYGARVAGGTAELMADMALPYGGPFGLTAKIASRPVQGMAQALITDGWRPLAARMAQSSAGGSLSLGAFEGLKGAVRGGVNPEGYESVLAEDKRNAFQILSDMVEGGFVHGLPSTVTGAFMVGGPVGQRISNGRGLLGNIMGWGAQVGVDAGLATAASAAQQLPKIAAGDVTRDDLKREFYDNVGTFLALGLHSKAKEFASLAEGGRSVNGVEFTREDVDRLEDVFSKPLREIVTEIDKRQSGRGYIQKSQVDEAKEREESVGGAATALFGNTLRSHAIPRDLKVKLCTAFNIPIPEYVMKPEVLESTDKTLTQSVDLGWQEMVDYEYNRPGGVADKVKAGEPLTDYELTLRLLYQDNKQWNEVVQKVLAGEEVSADEAGLLADYNERIGIIQRDYYQREKERLTAEFERENGLKKGTVDRMLEDVREGRAVEDPEALDKFNDMMREFGQSLDDYKVARDEAANVDQTLEAPADETPAGDSPKVNRVVDNADGETVSEEPVTEGNPSAPPVNKATGTVMEVQLVDGRGAYVADEDKANGLMSFVDAQGRPITMTDQSGYTIDRFPPSFIQADENGRPMIVETKAEAPKTEEAEKEGPAGGDAKADEGIAAKYRIPLDKDANPDYERARPEDTFDALVEEFGEENAAALVKSEISDAKKRMPKPRSAEPVSIPGGLSMAEKTMLLRQQMERRKALEDEERANSEREQARIDYWNSVLEVPKTRKAEADRAARREKMMTPEGREELLSEAKTAQQRAAIAKEIYGDYFNENTGEPDTVEELVSMLLPYGKLNWEGYERGINHVRGLQEELGSQHTRGLSKDKGTAGFNSYLAKKGEGESLDEIVHEMYEDSTNLIGDEHRFTTEEIKDAVIDMLLSAEKPTDIRDYILNSRIATAENTLRAELEREREDEEAAAGKGDTGLEEPHPIGHTSTPEQIAAEEGRINTDPTDGQKEAGNYQKGHVKIDGYDITIENPKGSIRRGTDAKGNKWETEMHNSYGYIRGTEGVDGDHIDVFLSDNPADGKVFVVDQINPETGEFDEHKVMYGFADAAEAVKAYLSNYSDGWKGMGAVTGISREAFKEWVQSSHRKTKPFREYAIARSKGETEDGKLPFEAPTGEDAPFHIVSPEDRPMEDAGIEKALMNEVMKEPASKGVEFITDVEEGQRVIDEYNGTRDDASKESQSRSSTPSEEARANDTNDALSGAKVRQNPETAKDSERKMFKTPDGHAYGFTYKGKIYIDPRIATAETPIHEYGHLWAEMKRQTSPEEWNRIKDVLLKDKIVEPFIEKVRRDYPELAGEGKEDAFVEEVLTQFSGHHGADKLRQMAEEIKNDLGGDATAETIAEAAVRKVKGILNDFWRGVCDMMGWKYTSAEDVADAVLRDMLNGVNPRERMKESPKDMKSQQEIERTLMGVHNISEDKLKKVIKAGGLANPSLAVIDTKQGFHNGFGEISLIPKSDMIDARTGGNAGTYIGDAYTPTYPTVETSLSDKGRAHIDEIARQAAGDNEQLMRHLRGNLKDYVEGNGSRLHYLFLQQTGRNPQPVNRRLNYSENAYNELKDMVDGDILDKRELTQEESDRILNAMLNERYAKYGDKLTPERKEMIEKNVRSNDVGEDGKLFFSRWYTFMEALASDARNRKNPQVDWYGTDIEAQNRVIDEKLSDEYEEWKKNLLNDEDINEELFAGFDRNGYRKTVPNTVYNASRIMNRQSDVNAYDGNGIGATRATLLEKVNTLSQIRKNKGRIKVGEEADQAVKDASDSLFEILQDISGMQKISDNPYMNIDYAEARLQEAFGKRDPLKHLRDEYGYDIDEDNELGQRIKDFVQTVRKLPVKYFETKFKRPVELDEFAVAVVPETTSPEVVEALKNAGLDIRTYDASDENTRNENRRKAAMEAVQGREDILFQKKSEKKPYTLSEEKKDAEGNRMYEREGSIDLWSATPLLAKAGRQQAPVRLSERNIKHIIDRHSDRLDTEDKVFEFLDNVFANAKILRRAKGRGMFVVFENKSNDSIAMIKLMPSEDGDYYNIDTAGFYRKNKWKESEEVIADLSEPDRSDAAADASKPQVPDENGGELINAEAQLPSSGGKDTKNINTVQEKTEESASGAQENENDSLKFQRVGNPEPEMTPEERQYWKKWDDAMKKWKERNAIPEDAQEPGEETPKQPDESMVDYVMRIARHRIEKAKWKTAPRLEDFRQARSDKDTVEAARENLQRYPDSQSARMRLAAAEFQHIRSAMGRQKAYDKATVKAVTDFAQDYMRMGFGDNLSRGEIERMLSLVKNATGAKDIRREVDNIMNILTDNYLRNLDQQVTKLSSTKELSKTAQGVEKQGRLELKGQRMIQAFREAREHRMDAEKIRERMAEVAERMARDDDEAPMWEQEYEGLSIALQYAENIEGSRDEWADLDLEYKDAVKGYRASGRSYKAQQELLESLDRAMMENKLERIGMFGEIIGRLQGNIAESMQGAREFVEREKQRVKHIQQIANFDLAGKDMGAMREKAKGRPANFFLQPLGTFEQMLRQFGSRNAKGEGRLYDYFMRSWMDATDRAFKGEQKAKGELDEKAREVFGDNIRRWSDLYRLTRNEKEFPGMDVEVLDQEEPKTFHLNQGNLLYIYMADKMNDGAMKLRRMGITEEDVEAIREHLDPRLVQLGDWLQEEYLPQKRTEYNKVHERMFGAPMAAIDHYFPIRVLGDARYQEQDVNVPDSETLPSTITGNIIKRTKNTLPLDILHTDALSLAIEHIEDMERWAAQAEWNKDVNTLLSYTTFRNKVKNMDTIYGSGDALWNAFKDAAKMAAGTYNPSAKSGHVDAAISNIAKGVTAAKINFRMYTAFKQILSAPAFLHDVDIDRFVKNSANPYGSWKWAMENMPVFEKRWKSRQAGDTRLMDDPTDWKMWKTNIVQMATRMGMSPNALVDGITCAVGARSIYESRLKKYKDMGVDEAKAEKRALQDAEIGYNLTQQSSEGAFVSAIQKDRTVAANMLSVFRNSSMAYTRQWVDAARNLRHRMQPGYREDSIGFMTRQFEDELGLDHDQAQDAAEKEYARAGRHELAKMLNMMFGVTVAWNLGASLPYLLIGDDDETKKEMMTDALLKGLMAGPTEGLAAGNIFSDFVGQATSESVRKAFKEGGIWEGGKQALNNMGEEDINPLPLFADLDRMIGKLKNDEWAAAQDVFNIVMQSAVGVNPQTFTDMWNAAMDYGAPAWDGTDYKWNPENMAKAKEIALFMMRLMNAPTSSWRNKYIDELGMGAEEAQKLPYEEMARRYAHYKHWKDAPVTGWLRGDEARQKKMESIRKQFDKAVQERMGRLTDEGLQKTFDNTADLTERKMLGKEAARREDSEDKMTATTSKKEKTKKAVDLYARHRTWQDLTDDLELARAQREAAAVSKQLKELRAEAERFKTEDAEDSRKKAVEDFEEVNKDILELQKDIDKAVKEIKKERDKLTGVEGVDDTWDKIRRLRDAILKKIREASK